MKETRSHPLDFWFMNEKTPSISVAVLAVFSAPRSRSVYSMICYEGIHGEWKPVGAVLFGNADTIETCPEAGTFENILYVQENTSDYKERLEAELDKPDKTVFDRICDEVFGDG